MRVKSLLHKELLVTLANLKKNHLDKSHNRFQSHERQNDCLSHKSQKDCASIGLITVSDAILTGRQSGQKLQCLYGNPMAKNFFQNRILHKL